MSERWLHDLLYVDTVVLHLALAMVLGGLATGLGLSSSASDWGREMARKSARVRDGGLWVGAVALLAMLWLQAASMSEGSDVAIGPAIWTVLKDTHFGHTWMAGLVGWSLAIAAAGSVDRDAGRFRGLWLSAAGLVVFVWSRSAVSHAGSQGDWSASVAADCIHLALGGLWVGIVLVAAVLRLPPESAPSADGLAAAHWLARLSQTATVALAGIVLTGVFKAWANLPSVDLLWRSDYGLLLVVKVGLVLAAAALGGYNRFVVLPPLLREWGAAQTQAERGWRTRLKRVVKLEALFLLCVLMVAAVLSGTEPPSLG